MENVYHSTFSLFWKSALFTVFTLFAPVSVSVLYAEVVYPAESYVLSDDGLVLEMWKGTEAEIDMTADENLAKVTQIGSYAFDGKSVETVVLGPNVETLAAGAFFDCAELRSITFKSDVKTIDRACFSGCVNRCDRIG